ncbi:16S rRNA (guanine(966)-N(2))-methyltransferase RsmD [Thermomicrobium sp. 4228-Ro]|uniref:16S rRNA (guanine(966)-N(2))-methyltransferase RsmD n=1 Tax=Thermomicrobium sp. 4228-Ro TaxID=2993937 RepID=UPI002248A1F3|nr:16S rRNA (guanine(966)-N(2))-methyltransferase RsmD [Thermomicrobium sp. 4228-Ro]MCX2727314.1 16S rRNA (guanine(966)-N(2))-methyltransferase RsmD [Thermomicrobium sp. 4228-Ro]
MRVIGGTARGRRLKAPRGLRTRPMADKIREALFAMLDSLGIRPRRVLDLYAGSGAVGIEALSRGAEWVDFVERSAAACAVIRDNLASTGFAERAAVHCTTVQAFLRRPPRGEPYDFVIMDPPYADPTIHETMVAVAHSPHVGDGTILVIGHSPRVPMPERLNGLEQLRDRCHGDSCVAIYVIRRHEANEGEAEA